MGFFTKGTKAGAPTKSVDAPDSDVAHFSLPVDSEHKAKALRLYSFTRPHMFSFHLSWFAFFVSFFATFAAAPLLPPIRNALDLNKYDVGNAGTAAVVGAIASRIGMGVVCDAVGPRFGMSFLLLLTAPGCFGMGAVTSADGFIICRLVIGFSLAVFVACQYWSSIMFSPNIVGTANAVAGGWGNMGGGATQLIMPLIFNALTNYYPDNIAWRWAFFIPGGMQIFAALMVLAFAQDLPDGQYYDLKKKGSKDKAKSAAEFWNALKNYRMYCLLLAYGYCFGVELTIDNIMASYFYDQFGLSLSTAGYLASVFGLCNFFSRPFGGFMSDFFAKRFGIRGRLWWLYLIETSGGIFCLVMGLLGSNLGGTIAVLVVFSVCCQAACGAVFGVVPFVSKRSLGIVAGFVGAGGNAGSAITQAAFFTSNSLSTDAGMKWMGVMIIGMCFFVLPIYFPMWGGMFCGPKPGYTEEDYYTSEFSEAEIKQGLHRASQKFANESRSQRGLKRLQAEALANVTTLPEQTPAAAKIEDGEAPLPVEKV